MILAGLLNTTSAFRADGRSTVLAARLDTRCCYSIYVPPGGRRTREFRNLLVYVHGEGRRFQFLLNALLPVAKACEYVLLCPLFPANLLGDGNLEGYKYLREGSIRYDDILLDIIAEIRASFHFSEPRFLLGGYSGGAQFAHRFSYLHANALKAVSLAAPGSVTLPDVNLDWWPGIRGLRDALGREADLTGLKNVDVQLIVGADDIRTDEVILSESSHYWSPDADVAGRTRVDRLRTLHSCLRAREVSADLLIVPTVAHNFGGLLPHIAEFFRGRLVGDFSV